MIHIAKYTDESQNNYAKWKKLKRVHIVWFHSSEILRNPKQSMVIENQWLPGDGGRALGETGGKISKDQEHLGGSIS